MKRAFQYSIFAATCFPSTNTAKAQSPQIEVTWTENDFFSVSVIAPNETAAGAGSLAMRRACDVSQERNHVYLAVLSYRKESSTKRVLSERGRTAYRAGADGVPRPVGNEADRYSTIPFGSSSMSVQMISQATISSMDDTYAIIESQGCTVQSAPDD